MVQFELAEQEQLAPPPPKKNMSSGSMAENPAIKMAKNMSNNVSKMSKDTVEGVTKVGKDTVELGVEGVTRVTKAGKEGVEMGIEGVSRVTKVGVKGARGFCVDFRDFMMRGSVVDLAIGLIVGAAFREIVNAFVNDIMSPLISLVLPASSLSELFWVMRLAASNSSSAKVETSSKVDFKTREQAKAAGAITLNYGNFCQQIIDFFIVALCVYFFIRFIFWVWKTIEADNTDWPCPRCMEPVKLGADKCPHCCSEPIFPPDNFCDDNGFVKVRKRKAKDTVEVEYAAAALIDSGGNAEQAVLIPRKI